MRLGSLQAARFEWQQAYNAYIGVVRARPAHAGALKGAGIASHRLGRMADAEELLRRAAAAAPDDASVAGLHASAVRVGARERRAAEARRKKLAARGLNEDGSPMDEFDFPVVDDF